LPIAIKNIEEFRKKDFMKLLLSNTGSTGNNSDFISNQYTQLKAKQAILGTISVKVGDKRDGFYALCIRNSSENGVAKGDVELVKINFMGSKLDINPDIEVKHPAYVEAKLEQFGF
jgi:hypothetical protein